MVIDMSSNSKWNYLKLNLYRKGFVNMKHIGTKALETKRLILRQFKLEDAHAMYDNWANDEEVTKYLMWSTHENIKTSQSVLEDWISHYNEDNYYQWAIILKENGDNPIGSIGVVREDDSIQMVHIGYCIGRKWWQKGITSEALKELIRFFFEEVDANRIESRHDPENPNSGKVMTKCGMKYEGTLRQADLNNQGICDCSMYAILKSDFIK